LVILLLDIFRLYQSRDEAWQDLFLGGDGEGIQNGAKTDGIQPSGNKMSVDATAALFFQHSNKIDKVYGIGVRKKARYPVPEFVVVEMDTDEACLEKFDFKEALDTTTASEWTNDFINAILDQMLIVPQDHGLRVPSTINRQYLCDENGLLYIKHEDTKMAEKRQLKLSSDIIDGMKSICQLDFKEDTSKDKVYADTKVWSRVKGIYFASEGFSGGQWDCFFTLCGLFGVDNGFLNKNPSIVLLDEPGQNLGAHQREMLRKLIEGRARSCQVPIITHHIEMLDPKSLPIQIVRVSIDSTKWCGIRKDSRQVRIICEAVEEKEFETKSHLKGIAHSLWSQVDNLSAIFAYGFIIVEGLSDKNVLECINDIFADDSTLARKVGFKIYRGFKWKIVIGEGKELEARVELAELLRIPYVYLYDFDQAFEIIPDKRVFYDCSSNHAISVAAMSGFGGHSTSILDGTQWKCEKHPNNQQQPQPPNKKKATIQQKKCDKQQLSEKNNDPVVANLSREFDASCNIKAKKNDIPKPIVVCSRQGKAFFLEGLIQWMANQAGWSFSSNFDSGLNEGPFVLTLLEQHTQLADGTFPTKFIVKGNLEDVLFTDSSFTNWTHIYNTTLANYSLKNKFLMDIAVALYGRDIAQGVVGHNKTMRNLAWIEVLIEKACTTDNLHSPRYFPSIIARTFLRQANTEEDRNNRKLHLSKVFVVAASLQTGETRYIFDRRNGPWALPILDFAAQHASMNRDFYWPPSICDIEGLLVNKGHSCRQACFPIPSINWNTTLTQKKQQKKLWSLEELEDKLKLAESCFQKAGTFAFFGGGREQVAMTTAAVKTLLPLTKLEERQQLLELLQSSLKSNKTNTIFGIRALFYKLADVGAIDGEFEEAGEFNSFQHCTCSRDSIF
jgi:hypothetical protein